MRSDAAHKMLTTTMILRLEPLWFLLRKQQVAVVYLQSLHCNSAGQARSTNTLYALVAGTRLINTLTAPG